MVDEETTSVAAAHTYFSAWCFNQAWELIEKPDRMEADDRMMVALSQASIFHWTSRPDCTNKNLSVGYWQASRIQALLGHAEEAMRHARTCLDYSTGLEPFYVGYAYEALARAASLTHDVAALDSYLDSAGRLARQVSDERARQRLTNDLTELSQSGDSPKPSANLDLIGHATKPTGV